MTGNKKRTMGTIKENIEEIRKAYRQLSWMREEEVNRVLCVLADETEACTDEILAENRKDLERMQPDNPKYDRLRLTPGRIRGIAEGIRKVAGLPAPQGRVLECAKHPNGMEIARVSVPFGVVGVIYEARPNVTLDVFALCVKSGNACVLKGGSDADASNRKLVEVIRRVLQKSGLAASLVTLLPAGHESTAELLGARGYVDLLIPRGGKGLIDFVRQHATVPVIETGAGVCHAYFDREGDVAKGETIVRNAKTRRVGVCNALDCLLVHEARLDDLPALCGGLRQEQVTIYADETCYESLKDTYPAHLLRRATVETYGTEFLDYKMALKAVASADEAMAHIAAYGSGHSECVITEDQAVADGFVRTVDAACVYVNLPTSFTDGGEFGLGAEIGISTQKLHARGPMGLPALNTCKWIIRGNGQIRT